MNYSNNAYSVLDGAIGAADTVIQVAGGSGARFPASDFMVTLVGYDISGNESAWEICHCTSRSGDTLTVARGQEGTAAVAWGDAARIEHRITAGTMHAIAAMQWNLSYSASVPDNAVGLDGDYHLTIGADWVYLYQKGIVTPGVWTYTGAQWVSETGIATMLADKAPATATLADSAASSTLPTTASAALDALLQTVRNCLKWLVAKAGELSVITDGAANTFTLASAGNVVPISANTTLPTNTTVAYPVGTCIILECDGTARTITGPAASSLTLDGNSGTVTSFVLKAYTSVAIRKTDTNAWRVYGDA